MTTRAMHMPMGQLLFGGGAHVGDLHIEVQGDTGQGVVPVQGHDAILHTDHREDTHVALLRSTGLELHTWLHLLTAEPIDGHLVYERGIELTVAFSRGHHGQDLVPGLTSLQLLLQARHDHLMTLDVREGIATGAGIEELAIGIVQGVMERDHGILGDVHGLKVARRNDPAGNRRTPPDGGVLTVILGSVGVCVAGLGARVAGFSTGIGMRTILACIGADMLLRTGMRMFMCLAMTFGLGSMAA